MQLDREKMLVLERLSIQGSEFMLRTVARNEEKNSNIKNLATHYLEIGEAKDKEEALKLANAILG